MEYMDYSLNRSCRERFADAVGPLLAPAAIFACAVAMSLAVHYSEQSVDLPSSSKSIESIENSSDLN